MPTEKNISALSISTKQMREAIKKSGYLLEQRVEAILSREGYFVQMNTVFPDPDTKKSREIDIDAISGRRIYRKGYNFIFPNILCECENNIQPVVFFTKESLISFMHHEQVKVSGIPVKFWQGEKYINLSEFTGMEKYHHYCKGTTSTQYCTFQLKKDKSSWIALHSDEQHDTLDSLIKALDYQIGKHFDEWYLPSEAEEENVNVQIYYPLVILQGDLYSANLKDGRFTLRKEKHIQFRKEVFMPRYNEVETYQIDIIVEEFLPDYLKIIDSEINKVKKVFERKKNEVFLSIEKIVEEAKQIKEKPESYRKVLQY